MSNFYDVVATDFPNDERAFAFLPNERIVTYRDVELLSARYANALVQIGVRAGDRVAVQVEKSVEMLFLYLAVLRVGAVFLPLNTAYTASELNYFLQDAEPALFVCDPARAQDARRLAEVCGPLRIETLDQTGGGSLHALIVDCASTFTTVERTDDALAAILYTSGTTGRSKGAMLTHSNLISNALTLKNIWRFTTEDVLLHALPIFHTHGLFVAINVILAAGASTLFLPRFSPPEILRLLPRATVMMGVPTFYIRLLGEPALNSELVRDMRLFISGSAPLSAEIHREFAERTGHAILERYGMTETNINSSNPYDGDRRAGTVGMPLPGVKIRVSDPESGRVLPTGEVGVIEISGPNVFKGYWQMPGKTTEDFRGSFFISGDLGFIDEKGYISIVGRTKDLIISGGYNVYPAEVEAALDELPQVRESAIIGVFHPDLGEGVVAVVVPRAGDTVETATLEAALTVRLARFKRPRHIIVVKELPKNAMGKVQKRLLRERYSDTFAGASSSRQYSAIS